MLFVSRLAVAAFALLSLLTFAFAAPTNVDLPISLSKRATYHNPIKAGSGADPFVLQHGDTYYMTYTTGGNIRVLSSSNLAQWPETGTLVWSPNGKYGAIWAPELHFINGAFYIYAAMATPDGKNSNHRMYAFKGTSTTDPTKPFDLVGQITSPDNNWAIDGTVLNYSNGKLYFIWSGWSSPSDGQNQHLYIAPMDSPTHISGNRVLLHSPTKAWQRSGANGVNEGPEILVHNGRTFLVYSAAGSWTKDYSLALMGIDGGKDPLVPSNWWRLDDRPVMWSSDVTFGPGHASFTYDRKGVPYVVYHAKPDASTGWGGRTIRTEPFKWNSDSSPWFPRPAGLTTQFPLPA